MDTVNIGLLVVGGIWVLAGAVVSYHFARALRLADHEIWWYSFLPAGACSGLVMFILWIANSWTWKGFLYVLCLVVACLLASISGLIKQILESRKASRIENDAKIKEYEAMIKQIRLGAPNSDIYKEYILHPKIKSGEMLTYCLDPGCDWEKVDREEYEIIRKCPVCGDASIIELSFGGVSIIYNSCKDNYTIGKSDNIDNADCPDTLAFMLKTLMYNRLNW